MSGISQGFSEQVIQYYTRNFFLLIFTLSSGLLMNIVKLQLPVVTLMVLLVWSPRTASPAAVRVHCGGLNWQ